MMETKLTLIGYVQIPNEFVHYQFIENNLSTTEPIFEGIVDSCVSGSGILGYTIPDKEISPGVTFLHHRIMQCYIWLRRKYEGQELKLAFWMEEQGWDWRVRCDLLA